MNDLWLRIGVLMIGLVAIALYYWLVVRPKNYGDTIRTPGLFTKKPKIPHFPDVEESTPDDVTITRRIPAEEADAIRAQSSVGRAAEASETPKVTPEPLPESEMDGRDQTVTVAAEQATAGGLNRDEVIEEVEFAPDDSHLAAEVEDPHRTTSEEAVDSMAEPTESVPDAQTQDSAASVMGERKEDISAHDDHAADGLAQEATMEDEPKADEPQWSADETARLEQMAASAETSESRPHVVIDDDDPEGIADASPELPTIKERNYRRRGSGLFGWLGRRAPKSKPTKPNASTSIEPQEDTTQGKLSYTPSAPSQEKREARPPRKMVLVALYPQHQDRLFVGRDIKNVMNTFSLVLSSKTGYYESLNALSAPGEVETVFSVGHLRGDSRFNRTTINTMETTGLVFFMNIPGPVNAADAVDMMFSIAAKSAKMLDAKVCDQNKRKLTVDQMINIRDEAVSFQQALIDRNLL